jgi:hypothetical protein
VKKGLSHLEECQRVGGMWAGGMWAQAAYVTVVHHHHLLLLLLLASRFSAFTPEMMELLHACLNPHPQLRASAVQLLSLPYFDEVYDSLRGTTLQQAYDDAHAACVQVGGGREGGWNEVLVGRAEGARGEEKLEVRAVVPLLPCLLLPTSPLLLTIPSHDKPPFLLLVHAHLPPPSCSPPPHRRHTPPQEALQAGASLIDANQSPRARVLWSTSTPCLEARNANASATNSVAMVPEAALLSPVSIPISPEPGTAPISPAPIPPHLHLSPSATSSGSPGPANLSPASLPKAPKAAKSSASSSGKAPAPHPHPGPHHQPGGRPIKAGGLSQAMAAAGSRSANSALPLQVCAYLRACVCVCVCVCMHACLCGWVGVGVGEK